MIIQLDLTDAQIELLSDTLALAQDEGPQPEGWQSDALKALAEMIEKQIEAGVGRAK
jgi:hypothetical protein